ncbi:MAG: hypothetical protein IKV94_03560 [Clostridia bacterium]|nr:hypothetical protein [Clostridia bacterium]
MKQNYLIKTIFILLLIFTILYAIIMTVTSLSSSIKNTKITEQNYETINTIVQNSNELSLQEKVNFRTNYFLFGKKIIGYKVRDIIEKIEI